MDIANAFKTAANTSQRVFSEAIRVLYAYPIFLVALGAIVLYTAVQMVSSCKEYCIDCMCEYLENHEKMQKRIKKSQKKAERQNAISAKAKTEKNEGGKKGELEASAKIEKQSSLTSPALPSTSSKKKKGKGGKGDQMAIQQQSVEVVKPQLTNTSKTVLTASQKKKKGASLLIEDKPPVVEEKPASSESESDNEAPTVDIERFKAISKPKQQVQSTASKTLQLPQKYLNRLFSSKESAAGNGNQKVRMVDSETQTTDEWLEELFKEKIQELYELRKKDNEQRLKQLNSNKHPEVDFQRA